MSDTTAVDIGTAAVDTPVPVADPARAARIRGLSRAHVFTSWSAQRAIDPLPLAGGEGAWFWDYQGRRFLDLTSQLVNANLVWPLVMANRLHVPPPLVITHEEAAHAVAVIDEALTEVVR